MSSNQDSSPADDPVLRETLKRCSPATYYAACKFRVSADPQDLRVVLLGVVERFVERDLRPKLQGPAETLPTLRLSQDLGLDSLTMMEIVMIAEEVLQITISNEELTRLTTLGQVQDFVLRKLAESRTGDAAVHPASNDDWNVAAAGEEVRQFEAKDASLTPLPRPQPRHA